MRHGKGSGWTPEGMEAEAANAHDAASAGMTQDEPSVIGLVQRVVSEGRAYAETEMERQKLRASVLGAAGRDAVLMVLAALFLLFGALTALLVGCVWMLAPLVGVFGALAITICGALLLVFVLLLGARGRMRNAIHLVFTREEDAA